MVATCVASLRTPVEAHPLGNFTINHLAKVGVNGSTLRVRYVLDIAEIPTFQIMRERASGGRWNMDVKQAWADSVTSRIQRDLKVTIDGANVALNSGGPHARLRPGAGGLPILYWVDDFTAPLANGKHRVAIDDHVYEDRRIGWKDIIVGPQTEPTHELLSYPSALIGSPRTITAASFTVRTGGAIADITRDSTAIAQQQSSSSVVRQTVLSEMFLRSDQGPLWILITILAAFGFGALHAIEPGHGKALLAFTLVGARATSKQAAILAASLTFAHTIGVLLLGVALFFVAGFVPETIYPWITLVSGVIIVIVGGRALARYIRGMRPERAQVHHHDHAHEHVHDHAHEHVHDHAHVHTHGGKAHTHAVPGDKPLNFASAVWAAMSGGIAPCPAAIILLIAAVNSHRIAYGLMLIVIFGLGLAAVLTGLGMAVVHSAAWISKNQKYERFVRFGPLASAALISVIGAVLLGQGFAQIGAHTNTLFVAAVALAAIAGYAFSVDQNHRRVVQTA